MSKDNSDNKIKELMSTALKDINTLVDVNAVIGKPFTTNGGTVVIPVTKVTMGFMTGGGEYGKVQSLKGEKSLPFSGGSGAVISLKPSGFLVDNGKGVKLVSIADDVATKAFETAEEFIKSFNNEKED